MLTIRIRTTLDRNNISTCVNEKQRKLFHTICYRRRHPNYYKATPSTINNKSSSSSLWRLLPISNKFFSTCRIQSLLHNTIIYSSTLDRCTNDNILHKRFYSATNTNRSSANDDSNSSSNNNSNIQLYSLLRSMTHTTRSIGIWEGIELLYNIPLKPTNVKDTSTSSSSTTTTTPVIGSRAWESIRQLPEIDIAIKSLQQLLQQQSDQKTLSGTKVQHNRSTQIIDSLQRAIQIFGSYKTGGIEQIACYALLIEFQNYFNQYNDCLVSLNELLQTYSTNNNNNNNNNNKEIDTTIFNDIVQMAIVKVYWYQGQHETAKAICDQLVDHERSVQVIARTGQAMTRLLLISSLDDVFSVRDPFRMSIKRLERMVHPSSTVLAAAYMNMGIAEMVWAETVSKYNNVDAPFDAAMKNWKQGITILTKGDVSHHSTMSLSMSNRILKKESSPYLRAILHARMLGNMAHGMLQMTHHHDYITRATEYASESLSIYDKITGMVTIPNTDTEGDTAPLIMIDKEGLGRTLSLLGTCYHLSGNAITAQGLFQSSLDKLPIVVSSTSTSLTATPLQLIEQRDTYERYIKLCHDWEKRESDAKVMQGKVDDINTHMLPKGWKDKSSIHGSLWFWTYAAMQRQ